jgi:peptidoglycan/LPS O-acetylase OafA/YrhL
MIYRAEINGLRAIAVIAVIIYHGRLSFRGIQLATGGFIGVDVFFVISGYLITSILLMGMKNKTFSFLKFYERRTRRIMPLLLFIMVVSLPFAWLFLLPNQFVEYAYSLVYSNLFSSNIYFHFIGQQYAAGSSLLKPFLHTWSLSVEEQYYIMFPCNYSVLI